MYVAGRKKEQRELVRDLRVVRTKEGTVGIST